MPRGNQSQEAIDKSYQLKSVLKAMEKLVDISEKFADTVDRTSVLAECAKCSNVKKRLSAIADKLDNITNEIETIITKFVHDGYR